MPRRSAADLATVPAVPAPREPPPPHLPPDEAQIWRQTVEGLPPHWFPGASFVLLEIYVYAVVSLRRMRAVMAVEAEGTAVWKEASWLYDQEATRVERLAKLLRLGPRHDRTKLRTVPTGPRPWDLCDVPVSDRRGFEDELAEVMAKVGKKPAPEDDPPTA
jgi:hypothetical protein